jgi:predicted AAA+ superfamily ATPase
MIFRPFWQEVIEKCWQERSIIWLMGVRRVGKTSLCKSLPNVEYFACDRQQTRELFKNYEQVFEQMAGKRLVLDEIHALENPSEVLKVAADHYPSVKIIATGSSTLGASAKFRDTLTGRKRNIWLTPLLFDEMPLFGNTDLAHRFLFGGLPFMFCSQQLPHIEFHEWMDSYWAKDIQDFFSVAKRSSFQKFAQLLLAQSGGIFEATKFAGLCEVARATITNYLAVLEETFVVQVIRPFSTRKATEIVSAPKVYGFDTGFVCDAKGWSSLRSEDMGFLWEHCVLNELQGRFQLLLEINYWRDKLGREVDFVIPRRGSSAVDAIECKLSSLLSAGDVNAMKAIAKNIKVFRNHYPEGKNYIVVSDSLMPFVRVVDDLEFWFLRPADLVQDIKKHSFSR